MQGVGNPLATQDGSRNSDDPRARAQQRAQSMAPRARAAEELSYRAPAPEVSRSSRNADDPRKSSVTPGRDRRNSDDPRALAPELRGTGDSDERGYEFAAPEAEFDEPDYEFAAPRAAAELRPSQREIVPPAARPRHPSQTGAAAPSGGFALHCEIDGITVAIEPTDLSAAGLFVPTPIPPPLDSELRVFLRIGDAEFEASGHVVQSVTCEAARKERKRPGFGLLFTHIEDDVRARLRDAIDALLSERTERLRGVGTSSDRPVSAPAPAIDPREHEVLERLRSELAGLQSQPPWSVLGISQGAEQNCAREAFFAASKRYHPHVYARYTLPEIKDVVTQLFIAYKRAFTSMTKTGRSPRGAAGGRAPGSGNPPGRSSDPGNK